MLTGTQLNPKQLRFIEEYAKEPNATQAAIKAGYSEKTAKNQGSRLLTHEGVKEALSARARGALERLEVTEDLTLEELAAIAFAKITDFVTWEEGGEMVVKSSSEIPPHLAAAIKSVEDRVTVSKNTVGSRIYETIKRKITFHPKLDALKLLAEYQGLTDTMTPRVTVHLITGIDRTPLPLPEPEAVTVEAEPVVENPSEDRSLEPR